MRKHRINFFQSPNPQHFNFQNLNQSKYHHSEDPEVNEDMLFATPIRLNTSLQVSPTANFGGYLNFQQTKPKRRLQEDISEYYSQQQLKGEQQQMDFDEIKEKIVFSENEEQEELLIPITPLKVKLKIEDNEQATVRKQKPSHLASTKLTPATESRIIERGMKKLAAQVYKFVVRQRRTSYKQVANKMLEQMVTEQELADRRGQMNVKRRVYDALNVLVALGVLRRSGHKIMIKRDEFLFQMQEETQRGYYRREQQMRKDLEMKQQLAYLKLAFTKKEALLIEKRQLQEKIKHKINNYQELVNKNKALRDQSVILQKQKGDQISKISFPILVIGEQKVQQPNFLIKRQIKPKRNEEFQSQNQQQMMLWQDSPGTLSCSLSKGKQMQILGELDIIAQWKHQYKKDQARKSHRKSRNN